MSDNKQRLSRREFVVAGGAAAAACAVPGCSTTTARTPRTSAPPAAASTPPPADKPEQPGPITQATLAEGEKLAAIQLTPRERELVLEKIGEDIDRIRARRSVPLGNDVAPATVFDTGTHERQADIVVSSDTDTEPLPADEESIAFAPVTALGRWIRQRQITSLRLTEIYLERLKRLGPKLDCTITLTEQRALAKARQADAEIAAGGYRSSLHGVPWGAKDLFDTAGIRTTWGATPFRDRVPDRDAAVVRRLDDAGSVLLGKMTLGALAYGDIWFDGRTNNPWDLEHGSSGSSAGSAAATAAGLVGFSLGTETYGSIVSPCMRCGTTGLRPTFGRVARTGAMALCWSLDKIGAICRTVEDCAMVLGAINGADDGDPASRDVPFEFDATRSIRGMRLGYAPKWFEGDDATDLDREALRAARATGLELVEVDLPDWPYGSLLTILRVEAAAAFEELTLSNRDDELVWQEARAWPNTFRTTRFTPAVEYVQAQRFRRKVMEMMAARFAGVDALISPSYAGWLLLITNNTGHPSLTLRCGFQDDGKPRGITLWGRLFEEGALCSIGMALERKLDVWDRRPALG